MKFRNLTVGITSLTMLLAAQTLSAQASNNGILRGVVKDEAGAPVANALVSLSAPQLMGIRRITTDAAGGWNAALLPPGDYKITATCDGFVGSSSQNVHVGPGSQMFQSLVIKHISTAAATVVVLGAGSDVDKTEAQVVSTFTSEELLQTSGGRDINAALRMVPGAAPTQMGLPSFRGASVEATQYTLNGVDIKDPIYNQTTGDFFIEDNVEDIAVVLSPLNAKFGRALGGGVNVVTKSGGNDFAGSIRATYSRPSYRATDYRQQVSGTSEGLSRQWYITLMGPIIKDKLWFNYATQLRPDTQAYGTVGTLDKSVMNVQRTGNPLIDGLTAIDPNTLMARSTAASQIQGYGLPKTDAGAQYSQTTKYTYNEGKLSWAITPDQRLQVMGSKGEWTYGGQLDGDDYFLAGRSPSKETHESAGFNYTATFGSTSFLEVTGNTSSNKTKQNSGKLGRDPRNNPVRAYVDAFDNAPDPSHVYGVDLLVGGTGRGNPSENFGSRSVNANMKLYRDFWGLQHDIDVGAEWYRTHVYSSSYFGSNHTQFNVGGWYAKGGSYDGDWLFPTIVYSKDAGGKDVNGQNGNVGLAPVMQRAYDDDGLSLNTNLSLWLNDQITVNPKLNVMVGLRVDRTSSKDGKTGLDILDPVTGLSPRVVFTFDPKGDAKHVFKLSAARYQDAFPADLTNSMFRKAESHLATLGWTGQNQPQAGDPSDPLHGVRFVDYAAITNPDNYRYPISMTNTVAGTVNQPGLKPQSNIEYSVEYRRALDNGSWVKMTYVNKTYQNCIAFSRQWGTAYDERVLISDFTGTGLPPLYTQVRYAFNSKDLWRDYNGIEIEGDFKVNDYFRWHLNYTYGRSRGNFTAGESPTWGGYNQTGSFTRSSELYTMSRVLNAAGIGSDQFASAGALPGDVPHAGHIMPTLVVPIGKGWISYAIDFSYVSGQNWSATNAQYMPQAVNDAYTAQVAQNHADPVKYPTPVAPPTSWTKYWSERGAYHDNDLFDASLNVAYEMPLLGKVKLFGFLRVTNLFNHITQLTYYNGSPQQGGISSDKNLNAGGYFLRVPNYGTKYEQGGGNYVTAPRNGSFSIGLKF
ncbi:TonB-dependent receptor [Geothrix sp. PMB-07]|uniref:TonB-dependent receptor n=1 Tax=Geothrix sp. PMB-07 TaxID=3068640 RepID=UPI002741D55B|nr:TonB-dependent receptor [Geothrix sp. PMB-07]WLT32274.1 carboxypeptidase regulatory-like domain-containing protein [Geothrix sp. PMB-07]